MSVTSGTVSWGGKILKKDFSVLPGLGILLENVSLYPELTGFQNLSYLAGIRKKIGREEIRAALLRVGLDPKDPRLYENILWNETAPGHRPGSDGAAGRADAGRAYKLPGRPGA